MKFSAPVLVSVVALVAVISGCSLINKMRPAKRQQQAYARELHDLGLNVMRFADVYVGATSEALNRLQRDLQRPEDRLSVQEWKVQQANAAYTIASGPNPAENALDIVVLATLSRMVIDEAWVGDLYGVRAERVQTTYHTLETTAWQLLGGVLTDAETTRLREIITRWRAEHPRIRNVAYLRLRDLAASVGAPQSSEKQASENLFSLIGIDPLAGLDPAVQEMAQTRELASRSMYYLQRMAGLLDMQTERLAYQFAVMPETKSLLSDTARASLIGSASAQLVQTLPELIAREREAAIAQLIQSLHDEQATVSSMMAELRSTLQAGTDTANAVHTTLLTFEQIRGQVAAASAATDAEQRPPFDIRQFTAMLDAATTTARELNALAQRGDATLPLLRSATQDAAGQLERVANHVFWLLLLLIFAGAAAVLVAALAYRRIAGERSPAAAVIQGSQLARHRDPSD
jgi:hypothetical protein